MCVSLSDHNASGGIIGILNFKLVENILEPICCKKRQKKNHDQLLVWGMSMSDPLKSFIISFISFRTSKDSLFPKPVTGHELFLAVSYSKPALVGDPLSTFIWNYTYIRKLEYLLTPAAAYTSWDKWGSERKTKGVGN